MRKVRKTEQPILNILKQRYAQAPEAFKELLPDIALAFEDQVGRTASRSPFGLTERERLHRETRLGELLISDNTSSEQAVEALENIAVLGEDGVWLAGVNHERLGRLVTIVIGIGPGSVERNSMFPILRNVETPRQTSIMVGVIAHLTWDMKLGAISVNPGRIRERKGMLSWVGLATPTAGSAEGSVYQ